MGLPQELIDYLITMISPPDAPALYWKQIYDDRLAATDDGSYPGLIVHGTPTEAQAKELERILRPGAHLLLVAPDSEPTGHTGACRVEDAGFEIRDTILLAQEAGGMFYVPKASRSEREAGCLHLKPKTGAEAVEREEGTDGLNSPRAGAGRTAGKVHNFHPTVKPVDIMAALLQDVPTDKVVGDPFMGSGTTGLACIKTGHSFVGIERDEEYLPIADARVRHWADTTWEEGRDLGETVEIVSDAPEPEQEERPASLLDFLFDED